jgi:hypothetical protein
MAGLSNPYATRPQPPAARPRPALGRAAVVVGVAAVGVGVTGAPSAFADTSTAAPVPTYAGEVPRPLCHLPHRPLLHTDVAAARPIADRWCAPGDWRRPVPVDPSPVEPLPWTPPAGDPLDGPTVVSVDGTVEAGVEPGCVVLSGVDGAQWTLTGPLRTLPAGVPLEVTGVVTPGLLSTCQQGEVLAVRQVALLDEDAEPGPAVPVATTDQLAAEARSAPVSPVDTDVRPACGPVGIGKVPSVALCSR